MPTEKTREYALLILPHLLACADKRETITYGELARRVDWHHRPLRYALYHVRDEICRPRGLPLITAIVVTRNTGLPDESFLPEGTADLAEDDYRARFEYWRDKVFDCPQWAGLLEELGLQPAEETTEG